jgi:hypothetical protein
LRRKSPQATALSELQRGRFHREAALHETEQWFTILDLKRKRAEVDEQHQRKTFIL